MSLNVPEEHIHTAHDHDPSIPVASAQDREPVLAAFIVAAIPILASFVLQVADESGAAIPAWLRSGLAGLGALAVALAGLWARMRVTPVAAPRLDDETPLIPMVEREGV